MARRRQLRVCRQSRRQVRVCRETRPTHCLNGHAAQVGKAAHAGVLPNALPPLPLWLPLKRGTLIPVPPNLRGVRGDLKVPKVTAKHFSNNL
ncbi:MAG: hypothetical protein KME31_35860 [Tolypothrix carrinoi HA7290-LM1]|nr:hypothetical protein [Tolypothrix carrinoi HA7290-LM1]